MDVRLTYTELTYLLNVLKKIVGPSVSVGGGYHTGNSRPR
jgi:hypothetical protein